MDTDMATMTKVHSEFRSFERVIFHPKPQWDDWSDQFWSCCLKFTYIYILYWKDTWQGNKTTPRPVKSRWCIYWLHQKHQIIQFQSHLLHNEKRWAPSIMNWNTHSTTFSILCRAQIPIRKKRPMMQVSCRCLNIWHEAARSTDCCPVASVTDKSISKNRSTMALSRKHLVVVVSEKWKRTSTYIYHDMAKLHRQKMDHIEGWPLPPKKTLMWFLFYSSSTYLCRPPKNLNNSSWKAHKEDEMQTVPAVFSSEHSRQEHQNRHHTSHEENSCRAHDHLRTVKRVDQWDFIGKKICKDAVSHYCVARATALTSIQCEHSHTPCRTLEKVPRGNPGLLSQCTETCSDELANSNKARKFHICMPIFRFIYIYTYIHST